MNPYDSIEAIIANSYKDFHAKGFDYICLHRSSQITVKAYFLNGDVTKVPEVVNLHNHRYAFSTEVLAGSMVDHTFRIETRTDLARMDARVFQRFDYMTPLNGGNGFTAVGENTLIPVKHEIVTVDMRIHRRSWDVHTIQMLEDQTVLLLTQYHDELPINTPTQCWVRKGEPAPDTKGLYTRFTADEVVNRLDIISALRAERRLRSHNASALE